MTYHKARITRSRSRSRNMRKKHLVKSKRNNRSRKSKKNHSRKYRGGGKPEIKFINTRGSVEEPRENFNSAFEHGDLHIKTYGDMIDELKREGKYVTDYPNAYSELLRNRYVTSKGILNQMVIVANGVNSTTYVDNITGYHLFTVATGYVIGDLMESIWFIYGPSGMQPERDMISPPLFR